MTGELQSVAAIPAITISVTERPLLNGLLVPQDIIVRSLNRTELNGDDRIRNAMLGMCEGILREGPHLSRLDSGGLWSFQDWGLASSTVKDENSIGPGFQADIVRLSAGVNQDDGILP